MEMSRDSKTPVRMQMASNTILMAFYSGALCYSTYFYLIKGILRLEKKEFHVHMFFYLQAF
jgi:hypothetical protein